MRWLFIWLFKRYGRRFPGVSRHYWEVGRLWYVESVHGPEDFNYFDWRLV